ncbi:MAG: hypothetical protein JWP47_1255 [Polaromonas sp.]|jgi:micrococcal nuclease|nr:hypothetical protein [Polaromonas sp.]
MKNRVNRWLACLALVPLLALVQMVHARQAVFPRAGGITGTVVRVVDGDTVWLQTRAAARPVKVRVAGIDAPEICQAGGTASRDFLRQHILRKPVRLHRPPSRKYDDYGRTLGRLEFNGEDIGRWMVSSGHAWSYGSGYSAGAYAPEQARAARDRKGLFAQANAENPRSFRRRHGSCYP